MQRLVCAGFALGLLIAPTTARAGLYIPGEPLDLTVKDGKAEALPFDAFRIKLHDLWGLAVTKEPQTDYRKQYLKKRDEWVAKGIKNLTVTERVALSGYDIRLGDDRHAIEVLQAARQRDRRNFLVESHLALLAHLLGEPGAASNQLDALQLRPKEIPGLTPDEVAWSLKIERKLYELFRDRKKEERDKGPRFQPETPDGLFPVQFVSASGAYEVGKIAAAQKAKIPDDAIAITQQLLFWLPHDARLYWLLAELYNASGQVEAAAAILDECVDALRFQVDTLRDHRRAIKEELTRRQEEAAAVRAQEEARQKQSDWRNHPEVFWVLGGAAAIPLILLARWQFRLLRRPPGH